MKKSQTKIFWSAILGWILAVAMNGRADSAVQAVSLANPSILPAGGGNNDSAGSVISADGRFVLFLSSANNLVTNDNGRFVDVLLRNRTNNTTTLVSVNLTGSGGGNGHSVSPVMSADGRYVAFESEAANLVANDTNGVSDVFLRDLQSGTTTLLSVNRSLLPILNRLSLSFRRQNPHHTCACWTGSWWRRKKPKSRKLRLW